VPPDCTGSARVDEPVAGAACLGADGPLAGAGSALEPIARADVPPDGAGSALEPTAGAGCGPVRAEGAGAARPRWAFSVSGGTGGASTGCHSARAAVTQPNSPIAKHALRMNMA